MATSISATTGAQSLAPVRKVSAGALAGAISTLLIFILDQYVLKQPLPAAAGAAIATILTFVVSYFVPPGSDEAVAP